MIVNHVMSNNVKSGIFNSILNYFSSYSTDVSYEISEKPVEGADVYHYHRPNLESSLKENSIVTVHHDLKDSDGWLNVDLFLDRYREARKVVCLNTIQEKYLNEQEIFHTTVIPHGYRDDLFKKQIKKLSNKVRIGLVSKRYGRKVKGEAYLYELMKRLDPNKIEWVFVGEGRQYEYNFAKKLGFDACCYERLPYNIFGSLYEKLDVLLMCSWHEGGPANLPEALATNTPVVGFEVGMMKDFIVHDKNGFILTGDEDKDASMIMKSIDEKIIYRMQSHMFESPYPNNLMTWQECIKRNVEVYRGLII